MKIVVCEYFIKFFNFKNLLFIIWYYYISFKCLWFMYVLFWEFMMFGLDIIIVVKIVVFKIVFFE